MSKQQIEKWEADSKKSFKTEVKKMFKKLFLNKQAKIEVLQELIDELEKNKK